MSPVEKDQSLTPSSLGSSLNKIPHSQSTPGVAGSKTPPTTPRRGGKMLNVRVQMLDDSVTLFQVQTKADGSVLFEQVCKQLNLLEADYFGLEYQEGSTKHWLDLEKPLNKQIGLSLVEPLMRFCVKFYTPDPAQLEEEYTRYLFCLQVKRDLSHGHMQCNDNTAALMASYIVQAECGDYSADDYPDHTYLSSHKFVPHQDREMEIRIMESHKRHIGQSPAEADLNLLETARRCELYGIKMHSAKDPEGVPLNLSVAHLGVLVFQNFTKINTFSWAKIRKLSFKRKKFLIKLHPEGYGYFKDIVEFIFETRNDCKSFWKKCVENHGFFRCFTVKRLPRQRTKVLSRGSSFRYSGKTQKQMVEFVRENFVKRQTFQRSQSFRHTGLSHSTISNVGSSISAHPLLPLANSEATSLAGSLSPNAVHRQVVPGEVSTAQVVHPTTVMTTTSDITSITSSQHSYSVNDPGDTPEEVDSPFKKINGSALCLSSMSVKENGVMAITSSTPKSNVTNGSLGNISNDHYNNVSTINTTKDKTLLKNIETTDTKRKRPTDRAYFITKELLMTERTYRKDLEVINFWLRDVMSKEDDEMGQIESVNMLLNLIDPIYDAHSVFLKDVEMRLNNWDPPCIADVLLRHFNNLELYDNYLDEHLNVLEKIDHAYRTNKKFEALYKDFEVEKVCYLPLSSFILKPLQRLLHYSHLLEKLIRHYGPSHIDYNNCLESRAKLLKVTKRLPSALRRSENFVQLCELERDMVGIDTLHVAGREFVRQGCLTKFSQRKGYQQRMFFLMSDMLLYTARVGHMFRVHGQIPLNDLFVEERTDNPTQYSFSIYSNNRVITIAANSQEEKDKWVEDIAESVQAYKGERTNIEPPNIYLSLKSCSSSDDMMSNNGDCNGVLSEINGGKAPGAAQRNNTTVHVCWHRNTSIGMADHLRATENQLSGFLLRKFKNSNGWQKLWVVFTNFCLFFYKSFQDDLPLASLPLLGYSVSKPNEDDSIEKDFVFKLQFKNHVYFFRAESEYTFGRWMGVISSATQHSGRMRLFSRKDSENNYSDNI
ncbi:FERM, ARHGEF and pleckstrin domain-containing protein 2-like isoform X1 [Rhopalosiphum maidis]|uniref:FERM, ARHGEF and pleckstrin domain-containing protein 2-like isoform X1 n=1 Tax=Rhopalosiphum maidis TaxID=43146 RepID=UPI000EFFF231|nr:FERM, ARHGEF and pleckstrin domain-containing protein 2-like isoform X1 [Rhopalosiphum maidis]